MPWEKSFDLDEALDRAITIFWAKGYEATSMADLVDGMGINKGSLYNAFGSKKALFTQALQKYDRENLQRHLAELEGVDDPVKAIAKLFDAMIAQTTSDTEQKGCFIVNTALELPNHADDVAVFIGSALGELESFFVRMIKRGQKSGAISNGIKAKPTAKSLLALLVGLRVLARGACDVSQLRTIKTDALRLISV